MRFVSDVERPHTRWPTRTMPSPAPSPLLVLQRSVGNSAVAALLQRYAVERSVQRRRASPTAEDADSGAQEGFDEAVVQRCGSTPPEQCPCHDSSIEGEAQAPEVQRACVETPDGKKGWKYEYDGCSLPANMAIGLGSLTLGGAAKDNPAGGDRTAFALMKPTTQGGVACDRHDECYQSCGTKKEECDQRMFADMKEICAGAPSTLKQRCDAAAVVYYNGLKRLPQAQAAFDDRKKNVCACDPRQIPPSQRFPPHELLRSPKTGVYLSWLAYQLILPRLTGYRVFSNADEYEAYIHPRPNTRVPKPANGNVPSSLRMR